MAHYEFECQSTGCGKTFDLYRPMNEELPPHCPFCDGHHVKKLFSVPGPALVRGGTRAGRAGKW
jgi:putative FmdB family regulatory protein